MSKSTSDSSNSATWINDGEKYGLVGLMVKVDGQIPQGTIARDLWVLTDTTFNIIPPLWREWLGSIRAEEIEDCNLFLISKLSSSTLAVLDAENDTLTQRVWRFYVGLLLASTFAPAHAPVILTGYRRAGQVDIRQKQDLESPVPCLFRPYPPIAPEAIRLAAQLGKAFDGVAATTFPGGHWRLFKTIHIYVEVRTNHDILERLHQYCRCIDGLILPATGESKRHFRSRTEIFIGPRHHDMMGEIYDVRSAVEHLHENRYLESFDRATRLKERSDR